MFFYGIPLWTERIIINSVLALNMHLCALKFIVQCNKVGSVEKIIRRGRGSVLGTRLIYTHTKMVEVYASCRFQVL